MLIMLMMRLLFKKILCPKNAGAAIGSRARGGRRGNRIFRISLLYFCNLNCIALYFRLSYFYNLHCCRGNRVFFCISSTCIVDCTLFGAPTKRLFRKVIIFQALSFTFASNPCSIIWEMKFVFWTKHRTIELVCKWKWSYEIQVWKKDMSNFSHETLLDLSYHNIPSISGECHRN